MSDEELAKLAELEAKTEVITVTGSLINRKEVDSPSPVSVVDKEKLQSAGITNVGDILQKIPAQGNAINAQNNNGGDGSTRINLRSLGTQRTLVLLTGRRVVPSGLGADDSVDFGTIPLAMIERVEVLKDGASAIYGSDAVAGVVNVITRQNVNETEASIYTTTTQHRDGANYDLSFVTGHSSTRGNITFSGGYQEQKPIMAGDRDFASKTYDFDFEAKERVLLGSPSSVTGRINAAPGGATPVKGTVLKIPGCALPTGTNSKGEPIFTNPYCTSDGTGGFRNFNLPTSDSFGDNYNFQPLNYLVTPSTRVNLFSNGHFDVTKSVHAFYEGQFNSRRSTQQLAEEPVNFTQLTNVKIDKASYYNTIGEDITEYARRLTEFGPRIFQQEVNSERLVVGLNGTIPDGTPVVSNWKWEGSYNYGRTDGSNSRTGDLILSHLRNALGPSFRDGSTGTVRCGTSLTDAIPGCVPLNLLTSPGKPGSITKDMIDYLTFVGSTNGFSEQHTAQATASGKVIDLPNHGDVSLALGASYRKQSGGFQPDPLTQTGDTTGNQSGVVNGSYNSYEGFGELSVVPVSGLDALKWVEFNAAGRAYRYNTFGSGVTGKLSGLVRTFGGIALRGTIGNAFRAPSISELYSGTFDSFPAVRDPCDTSRGAKTGTNLMECRNQGVPDTAVFGTPQQREKRGGNTGLKPEKAVVGTAGIVYEPIRGLDFTLDYWHIRIRDAITTLQASTVLAQCYQGGVDAFCQQIVRDPNSHAIAAINNNTRNVGELTTSGLDFAAAYQYRAGTSTLRHAIEGTYLFQYNQDTGVKDPNTMQEAVIHGRGFYDLGVNPLVKVNLFSAWSHPSGISAGLNARYVHSFQECGTGDGAVNDCNDPSNLRRTVDAYIDGDLYVGYTLKSSQGRTSVTAGLNNFLNTTPPVIYNGTALNSDESAYNFLGRQFYVRLGQVF